MSHKSKKTKKRHKKQVEQQEIKPVKITFFSRHPDWTAIAALFILLLIFFNPVMFSNKTLLPPDKIASKSFEPFVEDALSRGIYPLWNPYIFSGMPSFASLSRAPFVDVLNTVIQYGFVWVVDKIIPLSDFTPMLLNFLLLGSFVYLLLRSFKISPSVAFLCGLAMMFLPQVVAYAAFGHSTKLKTVVLIPLIFLLVDRLLKKRNLLYFSLTGLAVGLQLLRAHVQICFYTQLMILVTFVCWAVWTVRKEKNIRRIFAGGGLLLGAILLGVLVSSVLNLSVWEYSHYSMRGGGETGGLAYDYATGWSFPPSEIATFFIPSFMGFGGGTYWGPMPFTDFPLYFGIIVLLLAVFALFFKRDRVTWIFAILAGLTLIISFGRHLPILYGPMFKFFPFFNKFRAPKMIHILFEFCMIVLAGFGLQEILNLHSIDDKKLKHIKQMLMGFGGAVVLLFLILLFGKGAYLNWAAKAPQGPAAAYEGALSDGFKALLFFGISAGAILLTLRQKVNRRFLPFLLAGLLFIDFWMVDKRFTQPRPKANENTYFAEEPDVTYLKSQEAPFRILHVTVSPDDIRKPNWYMYHKIQNVFGYQGAKLRNYQELMDAFRMPTGYIGKYLKVEGGRYVLKQPTEVSQQEWALHHTFLKLTNVRYIICPFSLPDTSLELVHAPRMRGQRAVFEVKDFAPRVFFPKDVIQIQGKKAILEFMTSGVFDPMETGIIEEKAPFNIIPSDSNRARIVDYDIHRIQIQADVKTPSLMVLSEIYYPAGWKVFVDGREEKIVKTDYLLRSVFLEPGTHNIEFVFSPGTFKAGLLLSVSSFLLLIAGAFFGWRIERKKSSS